MDPRLNSQLENAIYACNPPMASAHVVEKPPPLFAYVDKLLFADLSKSRTEHILTQLRRFDWKNMEIREYLIDALSAGWKMKYSVIHCAASIISGLSRYQEDACSSVVDNILEDIR